MSTIRTITADEWAWLKMLLADERITQAWFLARCKAVKPSEVFVSQGLELMDRLREIGTEYRLETGNGASNDAKIPSTAADKVAGVQAWYA